MYTVLSACSAIHQSCCGNERPATQMTPTIIIITKLPSRLRQTTCECVYSVIYGKSMNIHRDVTKFEFEFDDTRTLNRFENLTNVLSALLLNVNLWKNLCSSTDFTCTESQRAQTSFFSKIQPITQTTVIECAM